MFTPQFVLSMLNASLIVSFVTPAHVFGLV
jgi:hypothetical protein